VDTGMMKISNISSPNLFTVLEEVEDEDIKNVYDESANLNLKHNPKSHVVVAIVYDTCKKVCSMWKRNSNGNLCDKGSRIILGWNDDFVDIMVMAQTNQVMHVQVSTRTNNKTLFCSFVNADNYYIDRQMLWSNLIRQAGLMRNRPWVLLGDFNAALNIEDHSSGRYEPNISMHDFKECVQAMEVADVNSIGLYFTRNQKPKGSNGILKNIDRIMVTKTKPKPFKFSIFLMYKEGFRDIVESGWNVNIEGYVLFRAVKRLKGLESPFQKLLHDHGNLHERVKKIHVELDEAQKAIHMDPSSSILRFLLILLDLIRTPFDSEIEELRKFKFIYHWTNPFKDFEWSNVPRVKLSLFFESDETFLSLQALSNLHYFLGGFMVTDIKEKDKIRAKTR
nr:hypothetical protein [Tanacetum cinerariifolium]